MWLSICLATGALWLLFRLVTNVYSYWEAKGVPHLKGSFPFGSLPDLILYRRYIAYVHQEAYRKLEAHPYGGIYIGRRPVLMLRDPEVIGDILIKHFKHFRDRRRELTPSTQILAKHLVNVTAKLWRPLRLKLTPTFTSGKLKNMFQHFQNCSAQLDTILKQKAETSPEVDIKELMARFTTDIICTCAFGLEMDSITNPDNEFRRIGMQVFEKTITTSTKLRLAAHNIMPRIGRKFVRRIQFTDEVVAFLTAVIRNTVQYREKNGVTRNDFLDLLIEVKNKGAHGIDMKSKDGDLIDSNGETLEMTLDLMVAQCFVFFAAGFETSSSVMTFCLYELALNPVIQDKLRKEIEDVKQEHGELTYEAINKMNYLDQVMSETLRKYPTVQFLNRTCTEPYKMADSGAVIEEGTQVMIPVYALHHDPKYYPNPEVFDPDRFSAENKSSIPTCAYLPFGEGPRNCIGMRFGKLQVKMGICTVLLKYEVLKSAKTKVPLEMSPTMNITSTNGPIYLKLKSRY